MRRAATLLLALAMAALALVAGGPAGPASAAAPTTPTLTVGSWDTALRPWLANRQQAVDDVIAGTKLDVLALQGVWTQGAADAITADPRIAARYPYSYYAPPGPEQFGFCPLDVPRSELEDFVTGIILSGVDPRRALQPAAGSVDPFIDLLGLGLAYRNEQLCVATILSLLQDFPDDRSPFDVIDIAYYTGGNALAHHGSPGLLVLSAKPLSNVQPEYHPSHLQQSATVYATVAGTRIAFAAWQRNVYADIDPSLGYLFPGARQPELAQKVTDARADLLVGGVSTGPGYQQEAHDLLQARGMRPLVAGATRCPAATHAGYTLCANRSIFGQPEDVAADNIYTADPNTARCFDVRRFATTPVSDHVGIQATCGSWQVDGFRAPVDMGGVYNTVKGGSTVPLKFTVTRGSTPLTTVADIGATLTATAFSCSAGVPTDDVEQVVTGNTELRYDAAERQFIQNWKTPKSPGTCYKVTLRTADGTTTTALFKLK